MLASIFVAPALRAEPAASEGTSAYVEIAAPEGCATLDALVGGIHERSERVRFVEQREADRFLSAEIRPLPTGGFSAGFTLTQASGRLSRRQVVAKSCGEAFDALVLLATLALDPEAGEDVSGANVKGSVSPPPAAAPAPKAAPTPEPARSSIAVPVAPEPVLPARLPSEGAFSLAVGAGGVAAWGPSPSVMPGAFLYLGGSLVTSGPWSPAFRLSAAHASRDGFAESGGTADFVLDVVGLDLCPLGLVGPSRLSLRACATGALGQLSAQGSDTRSPQITHRLFATLGGTALLSFEPTPRLEILAVAGAMFPLFRDAFQFGSDVFFRVQPVAVVTGIGLGFRIL